MGLCPFHGEKSPSFSVSHTGQFYHRFGCGASGDAIKFLTEHVGMTFIEAVQDLAQQYGLQAINRGEAHGMKVWLGGADPRREGLVMGD